MRRTPEIAFLKSELIEAITFAMDKVTFSFYEN